MDKWQSTAGPRQIKAVQAAMNALSREANTHDELTGVAGGQEHRSTYWVPFGGDSRPEVHELDRQIRERFGYKITRENVHEIAKAYQDALPEARKSRRTVDSRRSPAEDAELQAKIREREAAEKAEQDARQAVADQVMAKAPAGATRIIIAELHEDTSDTMTDYFSNKTVRCAAIGWGYGRREDFRALHAAAAKFPPLADVTLEERRDNYSMGKGNYLTDHGWDGAGSGWVVKSRTLPLSPYMNLTEDAIPDAPDASPAATADGVTLSEGRNGNTEIRFAAKPSDEIRSELKAHGFRWAKTYGCWYGQDRAYAEQLAGTCESCGCERS